jgi:hypothetical protein
MPINAIITAFVLLSIAIAGWRLFRSAKTWSSYQKLGRICGAFTLIVALPLLAMYGCAARLTYRFAPTSSPDGNYTGRVTELNAGAMDSFHTSVEVRSRWQIYPDEVFSSTGDPREVEPKWATNSELVIRYASGFPSDPDYPTSCEQQFKTVKITCEPVAGYALHPTLTSLRGLQLRTAIDQQYRELSEAHAFSGNAIQITDVLQTYISEGTSYLEALRTLMAAGFLVNRQSPNQDVGQYSVRATCRADVNAVLYRHGPVDSGAVQEVNGWIVVTCP